LKIRNVAAWSCLTAAMAFGVAACGDDDNGGGGDGGGAEGGGGALTVYSSLPLQGASRPQSEDVIKGINLALKQKGGKCGDFTITHESLDDATAATGKWEPGATAANARKAAQDETTIAYIGEFNSGASAISIPVTNEAGILHVSPSNTAYGLTKEGPGADEGEPGKYYQANPDVRNYGRVVPIDNIQGAAVAQYMQDEGVKSVYILDDAEVYGKGVAANTKISAEEIGIEIAGEDSWDGKAANYRALAAKIQATGADAVFTGGIIDNNAPQLYKDLNAAMPDAKLFGPDGVATVDFTKEIPDKVQKQTFLTAPTLSPEELPPAGQQFYKDYEAEYGEPQDEIDPYAVYGYEAMAIVCDSIAEGGDDRAAVIEAFMNTKGRESPLGTYDIDPEGDTTLSDYGGYKAEGGKLVFNKVIKAQAAS
jgi:branched-chain amino acid transport system substrate-binding protein